MTHVNITTDVASERLPECPPDCLNTKTGNCPRCYEFTGDGCAHGPVCENCQDDLKGRDDGKG
jgi:hypothetical protein